MTKICLTLPVEVIDDWNLILRQDECTIYSVLIDSFVVFVEPFYLLEENQDRFDKQFNLHGQWHFCGRVKQAVYHF